MNVVRYDPWNLMNQLHRDLDRLFTRPYEDGSDEQTNAHWAPPVDIHEHKDHFAISADVPGVASEDLDITMERGVLTLSGQRQSTREEGAEGLNRVERVVGRFYRRFTLPESADASNIEAKLNDGVLTIRIPKQPEVQPRRIEIKR